MLTTSDRADRAVRAGIVAVGLFSLANILASSLLWELGKLAYFTFWLLLAGAFEFDEHESEACLESDACHFSE
ncbi:MAG: hypothetical protein ACFFB3_18275 [Candidatus Hodarchaeota archaeon]